MDTLCAEIHRHYFTEPYHKLGEGKNEGLGRKMYFTAEEMLDAAVVKMQKNCRCPVCISR